MHSVPGLVLGVWWSGGIFCCVGFALLYDRVFAVTFDEAFARACCLPVGLYNLVIAIMIAFVIVVGMNLVGALLLSALVVSPALAAMRVCRTFRRVIVLAAVIGVVCALVGMLASIMLGTSVGSTIVVQDATACCAQGIEFVWDDGEHVYPDDYPAEGAEVVACGRFGTYAERSSQFVYLSKSSLELA